MPCVHMGDFSVRTLPRTICGKLGLCAPESAGWKPVTCGRCRKSNRSEFRLCQRGHDLRKTRDASNRCRECIRAWHRENRWRYMDRQAEVQAATYRRDPAAILTRNRRWKDANKKRSADRARLLWLRKKPNPSDGEIEQMMEIAAKYGRNRG